MINHDVCICNKIQIGHEKLCGRVFVDMLTHSQCIEKRMDYIQDGLLFGNKYMLKYKQDFMISWMILRGFFFFGGGLVVLGT